MTLVEILTQSVPVPQGLAALAIASNLALGLLAILSGPLAALRRRQDAAEAETRAMAARRAEIEAETQARQFTPSRLAKQIDASRRVALKPIGKR
ncbi:hypothetical protein [Methylobrevis pamukkalensis]|uniref:Uncharacterized protein n=1 Tax=Methylobrevis pamukkalensis TaxID=1439726 RepID=A0A1E3H791_9HYPH|nr:hypothetical protein [Methylobrevis pamukkalensis]ODN72203.1 hypothetical protein A6302_00501 [Methylobrevis pamukkalensis]